MDVGGDDLDVSRRPPRGRLDLFAVMAKAGGAGVSAPAVDCREVSLVYPLIRDRPGTFKEQMIRSLRRKVQVDELHAISDLSFRIEYGEVLGVIGDNGAGKSTLMKMVARVLPPTRGRMIVRGLGVTLIEVVAGFYPLLTATETVVLYGAILGRSPREMAERAGPIIDWAGLSEFADVAVRAFSSGMLARLGFSIVTDIDPDVLLVDEILSVGDQSFREKSRERVRSVMAGGAATILVSHDMELVQDLASRAIWLDKGRVRKEGSPAEVIEAYTGGSA
ncbi:MAG: ABC transporter ATP-binding protein [Acidimicrobiia bacterium]|nr:ABC transporter ATP-binding protein [Acidimicrobiia bacterium]